MHSVPAEAAQRRRFSFQARPLLDVVLVGPDERNGSAKQSQASGGECPLSGVQKPLLFDRFVVALRHSLSRHPALDAGLGFSVRRERQGAGRNIAKPALPRVEHGETMILNVRN